MDVIRWFVRIKVLCLSIIMSVVAALNINRPKRQKLKTPNDLFHWAMIT